MRILSALAAVLMFLSLPAGASAADLTVFTADEVMAIVTASGGTNVERKDVDGQTIVIFDLGGKRYVFSLDLCQKEDTSKCLGLLMAVGFKASEIETLEMLNNFNKSVGFLTAVKLDSGTIAFGRFVVSVGGITRENVAANLALLTLAQEVYVAFAKSQVVASSGAGGQVLLSQPNTPPALQPVALTPEQVKSMVDDAWAAKVNFKFK